MRKWRIEDSNELYGISGWGVNYFRINDKGNVAVTPRKDGVEVDLKEHRQPHREDFHLLQEGGE